VASNLATTWHYTCLESLVGCQKLKRTKEIVKKERRWLEIEKLMGPREKPSGRAKSGGAMSLTAIDSYIWHHLEARK